MARLRSDLDEVRSNIAKTQQKIESFKQTQGLKERTVAEREREVKNMQRQHESLELLSDQKKELSEKLGKMKDKFTVDDYDGKITDVESQIKKHKLEINRLNERQQQIVSQIELRTKIKQLENRVLHDSHRRDAIIDSCEV